LPDRFFRRAVYWGSHFFYLTTFEKLLKSKKRFLKTVLGIRLLRIPKFLGLRDPDPLVRGRDPDPAPDPSLSRLTEIMPAK
jgi:hypothetical protein